MSEEPISEGGLTSELRTVINETIWQASMCWTETPSGVFDTEQANRIAEEIEVKIIKIIAKAFEMANAEMFRGFVEDIENAKH